jgi:hypothetical protein
MSNTKHTPGPWTADEPDQYGLVRITDANGSELLICEAHIAWQIERCVNAAPELLAALRTIAGFSGGMSDERRAEHMREIAHDAIRSNNVGRVRS